MSGGGWKYRIGRNKGLLFYPGQHGTPYIHIPLPLLFLAKTMIEETRFAPRIVDARVEDYRGVPLDDVLLVGISSMTGPMIGNGLEIARHVRSVDPTIPIVWGGVHVSALPEQTLEHDLVDIIVRGEGEETLAEVATALADGQPLHGVLGCGFKDGNGTRVMNPERPFRNIDRAERLPYDLIDMEAYRATYVEGFPYLSSRGCPHKCAFCHNLAYNRLSWRRKSPKFVVDEIEQIMKSFSVKKILIHDDDFFVDRRRIEGICREIIDRGIRVEFWSQSRYDYASKYTDEFLDLLKRAGFRQIAFGFESGCGRVLKFIRKGITLDQAFMTIRNFARNGVAIVTGFVVGFPTETWDEIMETLEVREKIMAMHPNLHVNAVWLYAYLPGTPLYEISLGYGLQPPASLDEWGRWSFGEARLHPWFDKGTVEKLDTITTLSRFDYAKQYVFSLNREQRIRKLGGRLRVALFHLVIGLYGLSARIRWKRRWPARDRPRH